MRGEKDILLVNSNCTYLDTIAKEKKNSRGGVFTFKLVLTVAMLFFLLSLFKKTSLSL